jgi:hypothetical protein
MQQKDIVVVVVMNHLMTSKRKHDSCGYMDEKYAHDAKIMRIMKRKIPYKKIRQIEHVSVRKYKHDTLGFSFRKIR